jgi:hypothetical protein
VLQAALRKTSEALACELADPSTSAPDWSPLEWRIARASAALHGVSSLLSSRLAWPGPTDWIEFLAHQKRQTLGRHLRLDALLRLIDGEARDRGVAFVALKGAALHEMGLYQAGERPMADLDLFIAATELAPMARILEAAGFHQTTITWKHLVFESDEAPSVATFGEHSGNGIKIDLHVQVREILPRRPVDVADLIMPHLAHPGMNPYRSNASLMAHLLLHAAGAIALRTLRLVQLHDVALLSRRMSQADWLELVGPVAAKYALWWAFSPLALVARYYETIPSYVLASSAAACGWSLRRAGHTKRLWQVSFSDLRRSAFPGIEWSQSGGEALAYAAQRVQLGLQVLARTLLTGAVTGGVDGIAGRGGHTLPAGGWIALRPARPATLLAVRHALAQP